MSAGEAAATIGLAFAFAVALLVVFVRYETREDRR